MFTFDTLKQAIIDYTENDNEPTFDSQIPTFIRLAEERILKATQLQVFVNTAHETVAKGANEVEKPYDWLATYDVSLRDDPLAAGNSSTIYLQNKDKNYVQSYWPNPNEVGVPRYYADDTEEMIVIAPTPAQSYVVEFRYLHRPRSLADPVQAPPAPQTTWIAKNAPQALLYAALIEAYTFMKGQLDMVELYNARFNESILRLKNLGEGLEPDDSLKKSIIRNPPS